jgi:hypothetical protein
MIGGHDDQDGTNNEGARRRDLLRVISSLMPPPSSPSKRAVHIMNVTSGLCADPLHFHSFAAVGSIGGWAVPSPRSLFVGAFQKCAICRERLGGRPSSSAPSSGDDGGGGSVAAAPMHSSPGMMQCLACGVYAHRTCAFARPGNDATVGSNPGDGPPLCEVNLEEIREAFGIPGGLISPRADATSSRPSDETRSSSWSIFGKRPSANDDSDGRVEPVSKSDGNVNDTLQSSSWSIFGKRTSADNCLEEKKEPTTAVDGKPEQEAGVIESSMKLVRKTSETTKNIPTASAIGMVAGGVAGWAIAGPAGVLLGSQIGRNILAVGAAVEGGIGMGVLVMNLANAANLSLRSSSERKRELKLNSTLVLVRPDIAVEPVWGEYADEARRSWELKHGASAQSQFSSSGFGIGSLFNKTDPSKDERNARYRKDSDIVKADTSELPTRDKVFLLVNRILNDKSSLPGYQYRHLILKHKRRTMFGDEGSTANASGEPSSRSCRQDAHGIIKHVTATLLEVRPGLASSSGMTELTACAVEILIFGDLYDDCFGEIVKLTEEKDESLLAKVKTLMGKRGDGSTASGVSSSVSQSAISALQSVPRAHTPTDKLLHCVEFLERVSTHFSSTFRGKCIDADTLLLMVCQHVVAANIQHLHAEVAFIEEFSRDEQLLSGKEGYALITLQASLHYLDSLDDLPSDVSPSLTIGGDNGTQ